MEGYAAMTAIQEASFDARPMARHLRITALYSSKRQGR